MTQEGRDELLPDIFDAWYERTDPRHPEYRRGLKAAPEPDDWKCAKHDAARNEDGTCPICEVHA